MKCLIGLGSNLGDRHQQLERAAQELKKISENGWLKTSCIYENPAVVPVGAPLDWQIRFANAVVEIDWSGSPDDLLKKLKQIEHDLGRKPSARWAPRAIDLDILTFGDLISVQEHLAIPHAGAWLRPFVLAPIKDLQTNFVLPGQTQPILQRTRALPLRSPLWMGILNLTPDSFSDGGKLADHGHLQSRMRDWISHGVQILDLGAESTRPGATPISARDEWHRLEPGLRILVEQYRDLAFRPRISVDTRHVQVAELALKAGCDWINDVSGLGDPAILDLVKSSGCTYVLMHSLSVPADRSVTLSNDLDPVNEIKRWAIRKIALIEQAGIPLTQVIFDPGIGFGKTAVQSLNILRRIREIQELPVRLLVGHSRKSFMSQWAEYPASERDWEGVGASLALAEAGVDILRVHEPLLHIRAHRAFQETQG